METSGQEKFWALRGKLKLAVLQQQREAPLIERTRAPFT
jgi:hypothetical protein